MIMSFCIHILSIAHTLDIEAIPMQDFKAVIDTLLAVASPKERKPKGCFLLAQCVCIPSGLVLYRYSLFLTLCN